MVLNWDKHRNDGPLTHPSLVSGEDYVLWRYNGFSPQKPMGIPCSCHAIAINAIAMSVKNAKVAVSLTPESKHRRCRLKLGPGEKR